MPNKITIIAVLSLGILVACGEPATKAQIQSYYSNTTLYTDNRQNIAYQRADGLLLDVDRNLRESLKGRWFAKEGELCHKLNTKPQQCSRMYISDGKISSVLGGYNVAKGDTFGLQRKFGLKGSRRSSPSRGGGLEGLLAGAAILGAAIGKVCSGGACDGFATATVSGPTSTPASGNSGKQCMANKSQCYASCEGRSRENKHALVVSSPYQNCRKQCSRISC